MSDARAFVDWIARRLLWRLLALLPASAQAWVDAHVLAWPGWDSIADDAAGDDGEDS